MNISSRHVIGVFVTVLIALAPKVVHSTEPEAPEKPQTEPVVSEAEAGLLREVSELATTDRPAAIEKLRAGLNEDSSAALDFTLGVLSSQENNLAEAEQAYTAATRKFPIFARAWEKLGRVRLMRDRPREAAAAFRKALGHGKRSADLWKLLGYSYLLSERPLAAESAYGQALALAPDDREIMLGLAKALLGSGRAGQALPLLKELCALDPLKDEFWLLQANACLAMDDQEGALEMLECAHRLGIIRADSLMTLGDLYYNKNLLDPAIRRYDLAFAKGDVSAERMLRCAEALFYIGRSEEASRHLSQAQARALAEPEKAHLLAGRIAESRSDLAAARKAFEAALVADPLNGDALIALGKLHWNAKEYERAVLVLERASRVRGVEANALLLLAQIKVELDRFNEAVEHLEAAQELEPSARVGRYLEQVRDLSRSVGAP